MALQSKRKLLGQHFLRDQKIIDQIAGEAIDQAIKRGCKSLLEVGPGKGAITFPLFDRLQHPSTHGIEEMILAERDWDFAERWRLERDNSKSGRIPLQVEEGDFLDLPEEKFFKHLPLAVASNLPYSAGTAIVTRLARHPRKVAVMVLMFQAEVARRLRADVGTKEWGSLSVWIQNRWDVQKLVHVPPKAFNPPPKVDSEVVLMVPRAEPRVPVAETPEAEKAWESLLKVCFAQRRKMLRSGLPSSGSWRKALEVSGLDGTKRAEALSWEEWGRLYEALISVTSGKPS